MAATVRLIISWRGILVQASCYYQARIQTHILYRPIIRFTVASVIILCLYILSSPKKHLIIFNDLGSSVALGTVRQYHEYSDDAAIN